MALLGGDLQQAKALYKESLTLCRELGAKAGAADSLEWLACVSGADGEALRAARLFGAAEALREALGIRMSPDERTLEEPYLLAASSQLNGRTWDELWEEGRAMSMEAAIEYALSEKGSTRHAPGRESKADRCPTALPDHPRGGSSRLGGERAHQPPDSCPTGYLRVHRRNPPREDLQEGGSALPHATHRLGERPRTFFLELELGDSRSKRPRRISIIRLYPEIPNFLYARRHFR